MRSPSPDFAADGCNFAPRTRTHKRFVMNAFTVKEASDRISPDPATHRRNALPGATPSGEVLAEDVRCRSTSAMGDNSRWTDAVRAADVNGCDRRQARDPSRPGDGYAQPANATTAPLAPRDSSPHHETGAADSGRRPDYVIRVEDTDAGEQGLRSAMWRDAMRNVRPRGEDLQSGLAVGRGTTLGAPSRSVFVSARLRAGAGASDRRESPPSACLGDELVDVDQCDAGPQRRSNSLVQTPSTLGASIRAAGDGRIRARHRPRDPAVLTRSGSPPRADATCDHRAAESRWSLR